jgi:soluble lytic murein transglycosylase-like protein
MIVFTLAIGILAATTLVTRYITTPFDALFDTAAHKRGLDRDLLRAIAKQESNLHPDVVVNETSRPGHRSYGLMQILDDTAKGLGITNLLGLLDPKLNIETAARLLQANQKALGAHDSLDAEISSYNQGVTGFLNRGIINPNYVASVKQHYYLFKIGEQVT